MKTGVVRGPERARIRRRGEGPGLERVPEAGRTALRPAAATRQPGGVSDTDAAAARAARIRYRKVFACAADATDSPDEEPS